MAKNSPLSRWAGQPVLKHFQFQLTLDDPKLPKEEWITLRGNHTQLETLHEAVSTYVQSFLEQSQSTLIVPGLPAQDEAIALLPKAALGTALVRGTSDPKGIFLRPRGLLTHELALGTLATPGTTNIVPLSVLQLFDLANALDDYASELVALPDLERSRRLPSSLKWGQLAATGLIVIGLSASVAKIIDSSRQPASPTASQGDSSSELATQPPPLVAISPLPSIASSQKLPPPPPLGSTVPASPGIPTFPVPSVSSQNLNKPSVALMPNANARLPQGKETGSQIAMMPQGNVSSGATRSQPAKPMPKPLALKRELSNASPSQSVGAVQARSEASRDRSAQMEQTGTAFDTIPQVAEARQYFQQRWTTPQGLTQTLEYILLVGANGSIQRIVPLGQAAGDYVDRTGIPLVGEPFVSALSGGRNAKIRLVLSPDGSVKTFLEGFY